MQVKFDPLEKSETQSQKKAPKGKAKVVCGRFSFARPSERAKNEDGGRESEEIMHNIRKIAWPTNTTIHNTDNASHTHKHMHSCRPAKKGGSSGGCRGVRERWSRHMPDELK